MFASINPGDQFSKHPTKSEKMVVRFITKLLYKKKTKKQTNKQTGSNNRVPYFSPIARLLTGTSSKFPRRDYFRSDKILS